MSGKVTLAKSMYYYFILLLSYIRQEYATSCSIWAHVKLLAVNFKFARAGCSRLLFLLRVLVVDIAQNSLLAVNLKISCNML